MVSGFEREFLVNTGRVTIETLQINREDMWNEHRGQVLEKYQSFQNLDETAIRRRWLGEPGWIGSA